MYQEFVLGLNYSFITYYYVITLLCDLFLRSYQLLPASVSSYVKGVVISTSCPHHEDGMRKQMETAWCMVGFHGVPFSPSQPHFTLLSTAFSDSQRGDCTKWYHLPLLPSGLYSVLSLPHPLMAVPVKTHHLRLRRKSIEFQKCVPHKMTMDSCSRKKKLFT